ncbi:uncharacterized protein [Arachis hypogaea]|uniref:uncharacterized protein n=1 Tax=Arachis hypogaea TaxID=3818 RepID=UPI000DECE9C1
MSLAIDPLRKISPWKEAWSIEAKILTIWEDASIVNENMQKLLRMVLMDKQHHKIQATVEDDLITTFIHQLKEGDVLIISDFKVIPNGGLILQKRIDYEYLIDFVGVLCGLKRKTDVECNGKILKVIILEVFADGYGIASHHFNRLRSNEIGDLVSVIDDESFDWKLIRTIANLKGNNEDGQFFVVGKIKEIVEDPECYKIKILVEDGTSCGMFVLLDSAATKLLGRTCSDVFLLLEDEMDVDQCIKDHICFLIGEIIDVLKHQKWWYYYCLCNAPICHVGNVFYCYLCRVECIDAIRRYRIKIIVSHSNGSNIFILEDDEVMQILKKSFSDILIDERNSSQSTEDYTVPNSIISQLMNKKIVFIVDPRPVGYELNTSLHIVRAICDDIDIKFDLDPFVPHFPFEFKNPVQFQSNASIQCSSSSSPPVGQVSPISVLNWNCWTVNHDFHARLSSSQGSNLFGNHQPLTIREELRSAFGQCENTVEAVERMDECSG